MIFCSRSGGYESAMYYLNRHSFKYLPCNTTTSWAYGWPEPLLAKPTCVVGRQTLGDRLIAMVAPL